MNEEIETPDDGEPEGEGENLDLSAILKGWPYRPGEVAARKVRGRDGREKIQMRIAMGLIQFEITGRPDGQRPHGCESLFEYHLARLRDHRLTHGAAAGFVLTDEECEALREEAMMYYSRYVCCFRLRDFNRAQFDTLRNLRVLDFMRAHAASRAAVNAMEQYRPYIIMMNARARAYLAIERADVEEAARTVRDAIGALRRFYRETGSEIYGLDPESLMQASEELRILEELQGEIRVSFGVAEAAAPLAEAEAPAEPGLESLQREMQKAVEEEDFERAALLRDQIREMQKKGARERDL